MHYHSFSQEASLSVSQDNTNQCLLHARLMLGAEEWRASGEGRQGPSPCGVYSLEGETDEKQIEQ